MDWGTKVTYLGSTTLKEKAVNFGIKDGEPTPSLDELRLMGS